MKELEIDTVSSSQIREALGQPQEEPAPADDGPIKWNAEKGRFEASITVSNKTQLFVGKTIGEVAAELVKAQTNATQKIVELSSKRPKAIQPEKTIPGFKPIQWTKPRELSQQEEMSIAEMWNMSPSKALRMGIESMFGCSPEELIRGVQESHNRTARDVANDGAALFLVEHTEAEDYEASVENERKLTGLLEREGLPITKNNLEYAFQTLVERGEKFISAPPPEEVEKPEEDLMPRPPATLSGRSARAPEAAEPEGRADATNAASMPLDQLKALIQSRGRVAGARSR